MKNIIVLLTIGFILYACNIAKKDINKTQPIPTSLKFKIREDRTIQIVKEKAIKFVKNGFNAGDGYSEVWIRDYNTFIDLAAEVYDTELLKENLRVFFKL